MKIVLSKLPKSGWWKNGVPKYFDNPAMKEGEIPNNDLLVRERNALIKSIKEEGHEIIELDFPKQLDSEDPNHDFVFIRDPYISNQNGKAIILRAGEPKRRIENKIIIHLLEKLKIKTIEMPDKSGWSADGGEFYYCAKNKILFSGLQRNTRKGIDFVARELNVKNVIILIGSGFHLDTFFTPVLNKDGYIIAIIACEDMINIASKKFLYRFADENNIHIFKIPIGDALGTAKKAGRFAINSLPLPGTIFRPDYFSIPSIDERLSDFGIKVKITPTSQFQLSGGSVHCITNEL